MPATANPTGLRTRASRKLVSVWVSQEELAQLVAYAAASGLPKSEHVRRYGLNPAPGRKAR
jgi:hypothetical protein